MKLATMVGTALLALSAPIQAEVHRVEIGSVVLEDVPSIPETLAEQTNRYQQSRSASFQGWLADGSILISTRFGETTQVHHVQRPMAAREQLSFYAEPVGGVSIAPNGKGFIFSKDVGGGESYQLYWYELGSGDIRLLTDGQSRNSGGLWSNAGDRYAYSTTQRNGSDTDIHFSALGAPKSTPLVEDQGAWYALDWSPDDRQLLVMRYRSISDSEVWIVDTVTGERTPFRPSETPVAYGNALFSRDGKGIYYSSDEGSEFLTLRYDDLETGETTPISAAIPWDIEEFALADDGRYLAFTVNADGSDDLYLQDLRVNGMVPVPDLPLGLVRNLEFSPDGNSLGFLLNNARTPSDVYSFEVGQSRLSRWTRSETGGLDAGEFILPTLVRYPTFDKLDGRTRSIPAFYYAPKTPGPHPVLISIHGGPESQALPSYNPMVQFYLRELGIAVLVPNVRGSAGYGKNYLALDNGRKREDSVKDIGALLDWIETQPQLDAQRVALIGGSYGGYMVLAGMTHYNDRLRAGIDIVGISNFVTFLENTKDYRRDLRRAEYGDESDPAMREFLQKISPTENAGNITKPLFIAQGANDPRVPQSEAEQMAETIRGNGGKVWTLLARDEGHGFKKKSNRDLYQNAVVLFLQQHLLGDAPESAGDAAAPVETSESGDPP